MNTAWTYAVNVAQGFALANPGSTAISPATRDIALLFDPTEDDPPICQVSASAYLPAGPFTGPDRSDDGSPLDKFRHGLPRIGYEFRRDLQPAILGFIATKETSTGVQLSVRSTGISGGRSPAPGQMAPLVITLGALLMNSDDYECPEQGIGVLVAGLAKMLEPMTMGREFGFSLKRRDSESELVNLEFVAVQRLRKRPRR